MAKKHSQNVNFLTQKLSYPPRKWKYKVHDNLFTTRTGELKPTHWSFLEPGDSFRDSVSNYCRVAPMQSPIYSRVDMKTRLFVVPCRKLQPDFEEFITSDPSENRMYVHTTIYHMFMAFFDLGLFGFSAPGTLEEFLGVPPVIDNFYNLAHRLAAEDAQTTWFHHHIAVSDYQQWNIIFQLAYDAADSGMGQIYQEYEEELAKEIPDLKENVTNAIADAALAMGKEKINLHPFLAYHKIYDDWVRDGRFEVDASEQIYEQIASFPDYPMINYDDVVTFVDDAGNTVRTVGLLYYLLTEKFAMYPKDYFNTVGNGEQAGPQLNIGPQRLEIYGSIASPQVAAPGASVYTSTRIGNPSVWSNGANIPANPRQKQYNTLYAAGTSNTVGAGVGDVWAEVNEADLITPVKLRYQMALQRFKERTGISLGGSKYSDFVFGQFGIRIPEPYLNRSVIVGSATTPVIVDEVISQADGSNDEAASNVGDFVGRGHFKGHTRPIRGRVVEHCVYMCIQYIVPQQYYWQGLRKDLTRLVNLDIPNHLFQAVGQELVKNKELFFGDNPDGDFGYQYRYAFDQIALDEIHGNFRSDLAYWRTGRDMVGVIPPSPGLVRVNPADSNRIFAYTDSKAMPFYCFTRHNFFHKMALGDTIGDGRIG